MDQNFNIEVTAPESTDRLFPPFVTFRFEFNVEAQLMMDSEIDLQVDYLIKSAENLRKKAKKALNDAKQKEKILVETLKS
jgi:hypothetical protein